MPEIIPDVRIQPIQRGFTPRAFKKQTPVFLAEFPDKNDIVVLRLGEKTRIVSLRSKAELREGEKFRVYHFVCACFPEDLPLLLESLKTDEAWKEHPISD